MREVLVVDNLKAYYPTGSGSLVRAVDGVSFTLGRGVSMGVAGESGCGKSTLGYAVLRLLPRPGRIVGGSIYVDGEDITALSEEKMRRIRWEKVAMVFQGAMNSLNPVYTIRKQMVETVRTHKPELGEDEALTLARRALEMVMLHEDVLTRYPHELSGGMKQRVVIAMALMLEPEILIADEPTTALDVVVQAQIINLLKELQKRLRMSVVLITHDLSLIPELSDHVAIMYAGKFVEHGSLFDVYPRPLHPYTHLLLKSIPSLVGKGELSYIPGAPPDLRSPPPACRFHPRCPYAAEECRQKEPPLQRFEDGRWVACHRAEEQLW